MFIYFSRIPIQAGVLITGMTCCILLHSMNDLKSAQMNMKNCLI